MKNIDDEDRAFRGGSWNYATGLCHASFRFGFVPGDRDDYLGFRVALSSPQDRSSLPSSVLPSDCPPSQT